jgi:hypothetical protein
VKAIEAYASTVGVFTFVNAVQANREFAAQFSPPVIPVFDKPQINFVTSVTVNSSELVLLLQMRTILNKGYLDGQPGEFPIRRKGKQTANDPSTKPCASSPFREQGTPGR